MKPILSNFQLKLRTALPINVKISTQPFSGLMKNLKKYFKLIKIAVLGDTANPVSSKQKYKWGYFEAFLSNFNYILRHPCQKW